MPKRAAGSGICQTRRAALRISHAQRAVAASRGNSTGATLLGVTSRGLGEVVGVVVDPHSEQRTWQRVPSSWAVRGVFGLCLAQPRPAFSGSALVNIRTRARVDIACNVAGRQAPFGGFQCEADGDAMRCTALWTHVGGLAVGSWQRWCCWCCCCGQGAHRNKTCSRRRMVWSVYCRRVCECRPRSCNYD